MNNLQYWMTEQANLTLDFTEGKVSNKKFMARMLIIKKAIDLSRQLSKIS